MVAKAWVRILQRSGLGVSFIQHIYIIKVERGRFTGLRELLEPTTRHNYGIIHKRVSDVALPVLGC
jgi:hypothetical protein